MNEEVPSELETRFRSQRSRVALIVETSKTYGRGLLQGIRRFVRDRQAWSIYMDERALDDQLPAWIQRWPCDGIVLRSGDAKLVERVKRLNIPTVYLGEIRDTGFCEVDTNNRRIASMAFDELTSRGFKHLGYVGLQGTPWSDVRRDTFLAMAKERGIPASVCEPVLDEGGIPSWPQHRRLLINWLRKQDKPVGVLACYDVVGVRILDACREIGLAVPEDVAVIGVDNDTLFCELSDPPLSSVAHNLTQIGYQAAMMLDRLMAGKSPSEMELDGNKICVDPTAIVSRQSSDALAIEDREVARALHYIRQHACEGIKVQDVLRHVPLTRVTLKRRFEKLLGRSAKEEIIRLQMQRVKELLVETDFTLEEIASLAGFKHTEYLAVIFKKRTGLTPGQFRKGEE